MNKRLLCLFFFIFVTGCVQKVPEPQSIHVQASEMPNQSSLDVRYNVLGNSVRVECIVEGVSFLNNHNEQGKILLYIDDQLYGEFDTAAFIIKDLKSGTYKMNVEVVNPNNQSLGLRQKFLVTIP